MTIPASVPTRATKTHRSGARPPDSENGIVKSTGSGFQDGPSTVERSRWTISRPQMIHAQGSYVGADGIRNDSAASPRTASATQWRTATRGSAREGRGGRERVSWGGGGRARTSPIVADAVFPAVKPLQALRNIGRRRDAGRRTYRR